MTNNLYIFVMTSNNQIEGVMEVKKFIENFKAAFGNAELPIVFWYSSEERHQPEKTLGCYIKYLKKVREGEGMSFDVENISCGGGKLYTGFADMPPFVPTFVSQKEKYKKTPEQVVDFVEGMDFPKTEEKYIHFERVDKIDTFEGKEGLIFFATPDVLTGLVSWTLFDTNEPDAVSVPFGSGCSSMISQVVAENRKGGKRTFLGFFDPSVRPCVEANILSFSIPMSRFSEMYDTMSESCLGGAHAWEKVKQRINGEL